LTIPGILGYYRFIAAPSSWSAEKDYLYKVRKMESKLRPVLITTDGDRRGVFYGWTDQDLEGIAESGLCKFSKYRNCIYWSLDVGGVFGLCETGPSDDCRIGAYVNQAAVFNGVSFVGEISGAAIEKWEAAPCVS
jgi:hypothetical protein